MVSKLNRAFDYWWISLPLIGLKARKNGTLSIQTTLPISNVNGWISMVKMKRKHRGIFLHKKKIIR